MSRWLPNVLRTFSLQIVARAAWAYAAGPELSDALRMCHRLAGRGLRSTIGFWNGDEDGPRQVADAYLAALGVLSREDLNCYLSVKAPALGFDLPLILELLGHARQQEVLVHFDSLGPEAAAETLALIADSRPHHPRLGLTLPGRWRRSLRDADVAVELGLHVRVVKGQWIDPEWPDVDLRGGFLSVIDRLAGRAAHVGVATHDAVLAREAFGRLRRAGTPCELELLFGLPVKHALREAETAGVSVRFYVPYGRAWLPYSLSQAQRNPRIFWWVLRDLVTGGSFHLPAL